MGNITNMKCHCGTVYEAKNADLDRGWALSCSKRCAAIRRDFGRPAAKPSQAEAVAETHDWLDKIIADQAAHYGITVDEHKKLMSYAAEFQEKVDAGKVKESKK